MAEQMRRLDAAGVPYDVVPGVPAFAAAAASNAADGARPFASSRTGSPSGDGMPGEFGPPGNGGGGIATGCIRFAPSLPDGGTIAAGRDGRPAMPGEGCDDGGA